MQEIEYSEFLKLVGTVSGLGADNDFVIAAIERERIAHRGVLHRERITEVADKARLRAGDYIPSARSREDDSQTRNNGPGPDAALLSKAFTKRLEPWASELRKEGFGSTDAPFPRDLAAAADWIQQESAADRERWLQGKTSRLDAQKEIRRLADLAGLVVHTEARSLKYVRPDRDHQQTVAAFPGTFLDRLARETDRVSEKTAFQPEALTGFMLTGLQPMISRIRITKADGGCSVPGDTIPSRSVTLVFNAADVSYEEMRRLHAEVRKWFGVTDTERLGWQEFDFISLVDSMGGPPEQGKTHFWEEVLLRWEEERVSKGSRPLSSWRAARNKFERLDSRKNLRELILPNPPFTRADLMHLARTGNNVRSPRSLQNTPVRPAR